MSSWNENVIPNHVVVHPLVLLSTVDHYNRVAKGSSRRVVGILLGEADADGKVDVTNSFAVPFEEDRDDPTIWFLDQTFLVEMARMFERINVKERIVGFYSTGPEIRPADIAIAQMFLKYRSKAIFTIIDIRAEREEEGLPVKAYKMVETVPEDGEEIVLTFKHIPSEVGAYEAEEVGVEHLLRDINDPSVSTLAEQIGHKISALRGLQGRLQEINNYLQRVVKKELPVNIKILSNLQDILNLLPNLNLDKLVRSMFVKTNDTHLVLYVSSIVRAITALHNLVSNKISFEQARRKEEEATDIKPTAAVDSKETPSEKLNGQK